jgi:peptidylprolyl isomerase
MQGLAKLAAAGILLLAALAGCSSGADQNAQPEEVVTPSGLRYRDWVVGDGDAAGRGDTVEVQYTGWLYEDGKRGTQFDSSAGRGPFPVTIGVTDVIEGWTEGLAGMKLGGVRELIIPPPLAYGSRGAPPVIPGNTTLVFEVEVVKLSK